MAAKNFAAQALRDPAVLRLFRSGGSEFFANRDVASGIEAIVFDADAVTKLSGTGFLAQIYAGTAPDLLPAVGSAVPFRTSIAAADWLPEPESTRHGTSVQAGDQSQSSFHRDCAWRQEPAEAGTPNTDRQQIAEFGVPP